MGNSSSNKGFKKKAPSARLQGAENVGIGSAPKKSLSAPHLAIKKGIVCNVQEQLASKGFGVDYATKKNYTALHVASLVGNQALVKQLVENGANVNTQSKKGFTPLYMAAQNNHEEVVEFLLVNNANQSLTAGDGFTPLAMALQQGNLRVAKILIEKLRSNESQESKMDELLLCVKNDDFRAAARLIQMNTYMNPSPETHDGFTPLHFAARFGREKLVKLLCSRNAAINASTHEGLTALHMAVLHNQPSVAHILLENGASPLSIDNSGWSLLHMASELGRVKVARLLLNFKAQPDIQGPGGLTPLHMATLFNQPCVARILLKNGASPHVIAANGWSALHFAAAEKRTDVASLLKKYNADFSLKSNTGVTPLHLFAQTFMPYSKDEITILDNPEDYKCLRDEADLSSIVDDSMALPPKAPMKDEIKLAATSLISPDDIHLSQKQQVKEEHLFVSISPYIVPISGPSPVADKLAASSKKIILRGGSVGNNMPIESLEGSHYGYSKKNLLEANNIPVEPRPEQTRSFTWKFKPSRHRSNQSQINPKPNQQR